MSLGGNDETKGSKVTTKSSCSKLMCQCVFIKKLTQYFRENPNDFLLHNIGN